MGAWQAARHPDDLPITSRRALQFRVGPVGSYRLRRKMTCLSRHGFYNILGAPCRLVPLPTDPQRALGRAIRRLRDETGQTQEDLAHAAGISTNALSRIETGKRNPTWSTVQHIAAGLGRSLAEVAALSEELDRRERRHR
jgi:DNA-binding XRE family transcriptional regulator